MIKNPKIDCKNLLESQEAAAPEYDKMILMDIKKPKRKPSWMRGSIEFSTEIPDRNNPK